MDDEEKSGLFVGKVGAAICPWWEGSSVLGQEGLTGRETAHRYVPHRLDSSIALSPAALQILFIGDRTRDSDSCCAPWNTASLPGFTVSR